MTHTCPNCNNSDLHCHAVVKGTIHICKDSSGSVQLTLLAWHEIAELESYECLNCGHRFIGEEKI